MSTKKEMQEVQEKRRFNLSIIRDIVESTGIGNAVETMLPKDVVVSIITTPFKAISVWFEIWRDKNRELKDLWAWCVADSILITLLTLKFGNPGDAIIITILYATTLAVITDQYGLQVIVKLKTFLLESDNLDIKESFTKRFMGDDDDDDDFDEDELVSEVKETGSDADSDEETHEEDIENIVPTSTIQETLVKKELKIEMEPVVKPVLAMSIDNTHKVNECDEYSGNEEIGNDGEYEEDCYEDEEEPEEVQEKATTIAGIPIEVIQMSNKYPLVPPMPKPKL